MYKPKEKNMKKVLLTSVVATMATFASHAGVSPYAAMHIGYTNPNAMVSVGECDYTAAELFSDKFAYDVSGAFGVKYGLSRDFALRGEVEYDYVEGFVFSVLGYWQRSHTVLANAYIDFKTATALTPYFGGGVGYQFNHISIEIDELGTTPSSVAWQVGGGIAYDVTDALTVDLGYRYLVSAEKYEESGYNYKFITGYNQFRLGASYTF